MDKIKRVVVTVALEEGDDIREYTVRTDNRDMLAYERTRPKQNWPTPGDGGASTFVTFLAWSALYRAGDTKLGMREFMEDRCVYAHMENPEGDAEEVDPTQPDHGTGC